MSRNHSWLIALIILPVVLITLPAQKAKAQDVQVSYQTFYDQLAPYGQWVNDPQYGNVWVPYTAPGFRPYATDGHWVMTDQGNMWVSDEPWGWAAYHYGRWTYNGYYGWIWVPGYEWAPAWVTWRSGDGIYGWAPMGPGHVYGRRYDYPDNYWVFVTPGYLYNPYVYNYYERGDAYVYVHRTEYIRYENGRHEDYYYGPRREDIERETHRPVDVYRVSDSREAGATRMGDHEVNIYRPTVNQGSINTAHPANVVEGREHPIGRPEAVSPTHASQPPAFRQEHPQPQYQQQQQSQQQHQPGPPRQQQQYQQQPPKQQQQYQQQPPRQQQQYQQQPPRQQEPAQQQPRPQQQQQQYQQQPRQQQQPRPQQQQPRPQQQQPRPQPQEEKHR